jgi:hypothetical protein
MVGTAGAAVADVGAVDAAVGVAEAGTGSVAAAVTADEAFVTGKAAVDEAIAGACLAGADEIASGGSCVTGLAMLAEGLRGAGAASASLASGPGVYGAAAGESSSREEEVRGGWTRGFEGAFSAELSEVAPKDGFGDGALPRPSEYPKPKNTPQMSTRPKKTPSKDRMPSVISVSVCFSSFVS